MGSCVSLNRSSESAMKLGLPLGSSNTKNIVIPQSPIKNNNNKPINGNRSINVDYGSKEEAFFDSQPWLDSDCEDFFSVNGDFTPSRGNSPVHYNLSRGASIPRSPLSGPSPLSEKKKRLSELFKESFSRDIDLSDPNSFENKIQGKETKPDLVPKSNNESPSFSNSERISNGGDVLTEKERPVKSMQRCLPSLVSCGSLSERRKKKKSTIISPSMSPALAVNEESRL